MFGSINEVMKFIQDQQIVMVDLKVTGLAGQWLHITIPARAFGAKYFECGIGYDGSSGSGFGRVESGDVSARPILETGFIDPFFEHSTLSFLCETITADTSEAFPHDPRTIAQKAIAYMQEMGIADKVLMAPEFEFYVFDKVEVLNEPYRTRYRIRSNEVHTEGHSPRVRQKMGYLHIPPGDSLHDLRSEIALTLEQMGVKVSYHHHEVGAPGQCEVEVGMTDMIRAADQAMMIKYVVKNVARDYGKIATFMPKPVFGEAGNGMHVHQKLDRADSPLFYDDSKNNYANLSDLALNYIAGLLDHGRAITAFTSPSTNSFKRLVEGYEAPVNLFFSLANRSAAIRIPRYAVKAENKRLEYRSGDATANIYLMLAAMLMAGLDGILTKRFESAHNFGPFDVDISRQDREFKDKITRLPRSLHDALNALEADNEFLSRNDVFPEEFISQWIRAKRKLEADQIDIRPHPYEFELYLDA